MKSPSDALHADLNSTQAELRVQREKRIANPMEPGFEWARESETPPELPGTAVEIPTGGDPCEIESGALGTAGETPSAAGRPPIKVQPPGNALQIQKSPSLLRFEIFHGDCLEVLRSLPDGAADALVTDPPYPNQRSSRGHSVKAVALRDANRHGDMNVNGLLWLIREIALESHRLLKPSGSLLIFCDAKLFFQVVPAVESAGLSYRGVVIWDKEHFGTGVGFRSQHELIASFSIDKPVYYDQSTGSVIAHKRAAPRLHENQKPVGLLKKLIQVVCPQGGVVLDPFMGMGSTGLACLWTGRRFIGVELNREHFDRADELLRALQARLRTQLGSR